MSINIEEIIRKYNLDKYPNVVGYSRAPQKKIVNGKATDIDCVRIYVTRKVRKCALRSDEIIPEEVEVEGRRIKTDVVEIGKIKKLAGYRDRYRPSPCGVSTSRLDEVAAGTIGWWLVDEDGEVYLMSNNHVWAKENNASRGDQIVQPGVRDGGTESDVIAELYDWIDIVFGSFNTVDVSIAKPISLSQLFMSIMGVGGVVGKTPPAINMKVKKVGRSTGITSGVVIDSSATLSVEYSSGTATFTDVVIVRGINAVAPGDSGSPCLTLENEFVGLLFAGNDEGSIMVICKSSNIEDNLSMKLGKKISILTANSPPPDSIQKEYIYITQQAYPLTDMILGLTLTTTLISLPLSIVKTAEKAMKR